MTLFVLGVIVGWGLEYIAYTFWWKGRNTPSNDASSERTEYEARLSAKDREIAQLQLKLQEASKTLVEAKAAPAEEPQPEPEEPKKAEPVKEDKPEAKQTPQNPEPAEKPAEKKAAPKKAVKKAAPAKKAPVKKAAAPKKAAKPKKAAAEKVIPLEEISGVGAVISKALAKEGYNGAASLADVDEATIMAILEKAEIRPGNIPSWIEQAKMIKAGDMDALAAYKKTLK